MSKQLEGGELFGEGEEELFFGEDEGEEELFPGLWEEFKKGYLKPSPAGSPPAGSPADADDAVEEDAVEEPEADDQDDEEVVVLPVYELNSDDEFIES